MRNTILALAVAGSLAGGCGDEDKPMTRLQFCEEYSRRECENVAPACLYPESDCVTSRRVTCSNWAERSEAGRRTFVPVNGESCLARVGEIFGKLRRGAVAIDARDFRSVDAACERVFQGGARDNQPCVVNADCEKDLVCDKGYCGKLKLVGPGAGCANIGEYCPQGSFCDGTAGVPVCTTRVAAGGACDAHRPCLESLRCVAGLCVERLAVGVTCETDGDCASGFCEPFALCCGSDVRFAPNSFACQAYQSGATGPSRGGSGGDAATSDGRSDDAGADDGSPRVGLDSH
jgi:hypothetical protein